MNRAQLKAILDVLESENVLIGPVDVEPLRGDGSERRFYRLRAGTTRRILLLSPRNREGVDENDSTWWIGRHLVQKGLPVPKIVWGDPSKGAILFQDLGDVHLFDCVRKVRSASRVDRMYDRAVRLLAAFHRRAKEGFSAGWCYDGIRYDAEFVHRREMRYFLEAFVGGFLGNPPNDSALDGDLRRLSEAAGRSRGDLVFHRDFQSRNLMVHDGRLWIIDFQGMRYGPPEYDVAALLLDPYVMLPLRMVGRLLRRYHREAREFLGPWGPFHERFQVLALCRCLQALAAYAYLGSVRRKPGFLEFIPSGWTRLRQILSGTAGRKFPHLRSFVAAMDGDVKRKIRQMKAADSTQ